MTYKEQLKRINFAERIRLGNEGLNTSPYEENEKRVISGKIVNVIYHKIDWAKNFAATNKY